MWKTGSQSVSAEQFLDQHFQNHGTTEISFQSYYIWSGLFYFVLMTQHKTVYPNSKQLPHSHPIMSNMKEESPRKETPSAPMIKHLWEEPISIRFQPGGFCFHCVLKTSRSSLPTTNWGYTLRLVLTSYVFLKPLKRRRSFMFSSSPLVSARCEVALKDAFRKTMVSLCGLLMSEMDKMKAGTWTFYHRLTIYLESYPLI